MADKKDAKKKRIQITSPRCEFRFPKLNEPDYGNAKYPKENGEYSVQMKFAADSDEAARLIAELTPHYEAALADAEAQFKQLGVAQRKKLGKVAPNELFQVLYDKETEEPTGFITFKAAMSASGVYKKDGPKKGKRWTREPLVYDGRGHRIKKLPDVWSGTIGKVCFEPSPYFVDGSGAAGLKLYLVGVQILDLVSGGERSAESMGFGVEDDGYTHKETNEPDYGRDSEDEGDGEDNDAGNF